MVGFLVLAGGQGKRIKTNKALLMLGGKPLLIHVLEKVQDLFNEKVVVIGNKDNPEEYKAILPSTFTLVQDIKYGQGPLGGILSGIRNMRSRYVFVSPCDSPFVNREVIKYLIRQRRNADAVIPVWPNGNKEPLHSIYRVSSAFKAAEIALNKGELLVLDMIKCLREVKYVKVEKLKEFDAELMTFFNINQRKDFESAKRLYTFFQDGSASPAI